MNECIPFIIIAIIIIYLNNCNYGIISKFTNFSGNGSRIFNGRDILNEPHSEESLHPIYI